MKQERFRFITAITCHSNTLVLFFPCGIRPVFLAFLGFICIFVSPLFLLMNYLQHSKTTAEITNDYCHRRMGAFLLFVIIPFSPWFSIKFFPHVSLVTTDKKQKKTHTFCQWNLVLLSRGGSSSLCCCNDYRMGKSWEKEKKGDRG